MAAEEKSHICLEGDITSATDSYLHLQSIYNRCLEGETTKFKKGQVPWNKGKQRTEMLGDNNPAKRPEVRAKISLSKIGNKAKLGYKLSKESIRRVSEAKMGNRNPNFGKPMSIEQKKKRSENAKINPNYGMKNKHQPEAAKDKISKANKGRVSPNKGKRPSEATRNKQSESHKELIPWNKGKQGCQIPWNKGRFGEGMPMFGRRGEEHPAWKGGIAFLPYCPKFNRILKEKVRERDNRTCQLCSEKENGTKLSIHHIHYDKENCHPDLISLCRKCNTKANFNRENYEGFFMNKLNERTLLFWRAM